MDQSTLRPTDWNMYVGQKSLKERLRIHIDSALARNTRLDHLLLIGPPGTGKTSISHIIADEMGEEMAAFKCPVDSMTLMVAVRKGYNMLLLDEIHLAPSKQQHDLLTLLEGGYLQNRSGIRYEMPEVTVIGATTEPDKILAPLYERFPIRPPFDAYSLDEMSTIVRGMCEAVDLNAPKDLVEGLAAASGGTPRNARSLVFMTRDLTLAHGELPDTTEVLRQCRITPDGLTDDHVRYLTVLEAIGGTAGIEVLASHLRLPRPFLLTLELLLVRQGLINYTSRGRELTASGYAALR